MHKNLISLVACLTLNNNKSHNYHSKLFRLSNNNGSIFKSNYICLDILPSVIKLNFLKMHYSCIIIGGLRGRVG